MYGGGGRQWHPVSNRPSTILKTLKCDAHDRDWETEYDNSETGCWYQAGPAIVHFRYNSDSQRKAKANAALIAASPNLYDLLEKIRKAISYDTTMGFSIHTFLIEELAQEIDAELARARGEQ